MNILGLYITPCPFQLELVLLQVAGSHLLAISITKFATI